MKTIWKYPLTIQVEPQTLSIPAIPQYPEVVLVSDQNGQLCMWVEVEDQALPRDVKVQVVGTGSKRPIGVHAGSVVIDEFVWHVYLV